jgi:antitoxin CcdA
MRIGFSGILIMPNPARATTAAPLKRAVNLTLNEMLVAQAKTYTSNLSATMEALLADYVATQQHARAGRQQQADNCAADWNAVHAAIGSFAHEHSTL